MKYMDSPSKVKGKLTSSLPHTPLIVTLQFSDSKMRVTLQKIPGNSLVPVQPKSCFHYYVISCATVIYPR